MTDQRRFESLDGFRGVCALLVAFMHLQAAHSLYFNPFVRHSFAFVDFFFVLSGWVISYTYQNRLHGVGDARIFLLRRFGRLWPLHIAMLVVLIVAQLAALAGQQGLGIHMPKAPFTDNWDPRAIPLHIFMLQAIGQPREGTWNLPSWSIAAEFWTYIVYALLVLSLPRRWRVAGYLAVAFGGLAGIYVLSPTYMDATFDYGLLRCFGGFFLGVVAQTFWKPERRPLDRRLWTVIELIMIGCVVTDVVLLGRSPWGLITPFVFAPTIFVFAYQGGMVSALMKSTPFAKLGLWSYSLYMTQSIYDLIVFRNLPIIVGHHLGRPLTTTIVYDGQRRTLLSIGGAIGTDALALVYIAAVIVTASLSYRFIEVPSRDWFYNRIRPKPKSAPPVAQPRAAG